MREDSGAARAIGVVVAARAAVGVGRGADAAIELTGELALIAVPLRALVLVGARDRAQVEAQRLVRLLVAEALADDAVDVGFAKEPEQAGQADVRAPAAGQLEEAEVVGRAAILRVAVGDADVGRVRGRGDQLRQAGLARPARRPARRSIRSARRCR